MLFDERVVELVGSSLPVSLAVALLVVGYLGSVYVVVPGTVLGALSSRRRLTWPAIVAFTYGLFVFLKPAVGLERPATEPPLTAEMLPGTLVPLYDLGLSFTSATFPSGHAMVATAFWGLVVVDTDLSTARVRAVAGACVVSLVAVSRVALGVHYPGDVLAGVAIGLAVLAVALSLRRRLAEPMEPLLALAFVPSLGAVLTGRSSDGFVLVCAVAALALLYWLTRRVPAVGFSPIRRPSER